MRRNERTGVVDETRHSAATSGWPAALTPARQRKATFKNGAAFINQKSKVKLCARARFKAQK